MGISDFKKGCLPRTNVAKDEKVICLQTATVVWNHCPQLLNVRVVNDVRQTELHTAEPLVPEPSASDLKIAIEKLKRL